MALNDYWWIALLFIGLQPVIRQKDARGQTTEMPQEVYDLMRLFPQPTRTRPSVEYVPLPYTRPEKP